MFDYPSCGAPGKGVLLLVSVAPCDNCYLKDRTKESKNNKSRMHSYVYVTQKQIDDFADEIEIDSIFLNVSYDFDDTEFEYAIVFREKKTAGSYSFIDEFELQISKLEQELLEKEAKILLLENEVKILLLENEVKALTEAHNRHKFIFSVIENNNLIPKFITESEYKKNKVKAIAYAEINESLSIVCDEDNRKVKFCIFIPHENRFKDCK